MSWEDVERSFDKARPEDIVITMGLDRLAELVGRVASEYARIADLPQFDPNSELACHLVVDAWRYCCHMVDREEFKASVSADLAALEPEPVAPLSSTPEHLPEFGGAASLPHRAPDALNRRLEPPV